MTTIDTMPSKLAQDSSRMNADALRAGESLQRGSEERRNLAFGIRNRRAAWQAWGRGMIGDDTLACAIQRTPGELRALASRSLLTPSGC